MHVSLIISYQISLIKFLFRTGWSGNKPTSWGSNTYSNKQYYGGGTSWSKPSKMASLSSMTANPSFASKPFKKKSALSTMKKTAMLAGGAYLAYKGTISYFA